MVGDEVIWARMLKVWESPFAATISFWMSEIRSIAEVCGIFQQGKVPSVGRITVNRLFHLAVLLVPRPFDSSTKPLEFLRARKFEVVSVHRYFYIERRSISQRLVLYTNKWNVWNLPIGSLYRMEIQVRRKIEWNGARSFVSSFAFHSSLNLFPLIVIESVHEFHEKEYVHSTLSIHEEVLDE